MASHHWPRETPHPPLCTKPPLFQLIASPSQNPKPINTFPFHFYFPFSLLFTSLHQNPNLHHLLHLHHHNHHHNYSNFPTSSSSSFITMETTTRASTPPRLHLLLHHQLPSLPPSLHHQPLLLVGNFHHQDLVNS